jgi:PmbA protein
MQTKTENTEKLIELAKKNGASEVEVIEKSWTNNPVSFENNNLKSLESNESSGIAIRLIKDGKIGIASSTDPEAIEQTAISAIEASEFGPEATFSFSKDPINHPAVGEARQGRQPSTINPILPLENLVERGNKIISELKTFHKDLLISGGFELGYGKTKYLNSNGVSGERGKSVYSTSFYANLVRGEDFLGIYDGDCSLETFPSEEKIKAKILEKLNHSKETLIVETKKYPVYFTPSAVSSIFVGIFSVILNGKTIQQKISPLTSKLGEKLFDTRLSYIEDPTLGTSRTPFDDEGIQTKKKSLIKDGIINSFYFDQATASKCSPKQMSTGNGFKGGLSLPPSAGLTTTIIEAKGERKQSEIISSIKDGIIIDHVLGAGQSNTLAGEFSVGIELGFKVENGVIKGRIKNCMVAGNIFELLKNISEISEDREWLYGSSLYPGFLIEGLTVAAK